MKFKFALVLIAILFVAAACNKQSGPQPEPSAGVPPSSAQNNPVPPESLPNNESPAVIITDSSISPASLQVKKGTTVRFINSGSKNHWPASAPHPTHTDYPEFDPKQPIAAGATWSFTFNKTGTWKYHDHLQPSLFGSVTVTE